MSSAVSGSGSSGSSALGENLECGRKEEEKEEEDLAFLAALVLAEDGARGGVRDSEAVE